MAMYHAHHKVLSRSTRNTVASLAYRSGTCLVNGQTGEVSDYRTKGVQHVEILLPNDAPLWAQEMRDLVQEDRVMGLQTLSDLAEGAEKRRDSQLYREFEFSLPKELSDTQNISLANAFVKDQCCGRGMLAIQNFHFDVDAKTGERKPHCHTLLLTRSLTEEGLSPLKEREWNAKEFHNTLREQWAQYQNFHLKLHGFEARVDHRSYEAQGIELEAQPKLGKNVLEMEQKGRETESPSGQPKTWRFQDFMDTQVRNTYQLLKSPDVILKAASSTQSVFGLQQMTQVIHRYVDDRHLRDRLLEKALASSELVQLPSQSGEVHYTTLSLLKSELGLVDRALSLSQTQSHGLKEEVPLNLSTVSKGSQTQGSLTPGSETLSEEQWNAVAHMVKDQQLSCVVGYAGAGKTTTLKVAQQLWKEAGYEVLGFAPTGRAAQNLSESGIKSQTLHRFLYQFEQGRCQFNSRTVLVLDEAGMVDIGRMDRFLQAVETLGVKAVVVGDGAQLQAIEAGDAFRLVTKHVEPFVMVDVRRQLQDWQREATKAFGRQETEKGLSAYLERGHITFVEEKIPSLESLKEAGDMKGVVTLYNLSRRLSGRIWVASHGGTGAGTDHASAHDRDLFQTWRDVKLECASHMATNLDACRVHMQALGVDPLAFAETFVEGKTRETRLERAQEIAQRWRLPELVHGQAKHLCDTRAAAREVLVTAWKTSVLDNPNSSHLMLAYTNKDVTSLNSQARLFMRDCGIIKGAEYTYVTTKDAKGPLEGSPLDGGHLSGKKSLQEQRGFSVGDRLVFCKNDRGLDVKNGMMGTVSSLSLSKISVVLDDTTRTVSFSPNLYKSFDHGWAVTLHKAQGITVDRVFKLASFEEYRNLAYVGMTRHREDLQVFGSLLDFWRHGVFLARLSAPHDKASLLDYAPKETLEQTLEDARSHRLMGVLGTIGNHLEAMGFVAKHLYQKTIDMFLSPRGEGERDLQPHLCVQEFEKTHGTRESAARDTLGQRAQYEASKWAQVKEIAKDAFMRKEGIEHLRPIDLLAIERETQKILSIESRIFVEHAQKGKPLSDSQVFIMAMREMKQLAQEQSILEKAFAQHHTPFVAKSVAEDIIHRKALYGTDPTPEHVQQSIYS